MMWVATETDELLEEEVFSPKGVGAEEGGPEMGIASVKKADEVEEAFLPLLTPVVFLPSELVRKKDGTGEGGRFIFTPLDLRGERVVGKGMRVLRTAAPSFPAVPTLPLPLPPGPVLTFLGEAGGVGMVEKACWSGDGAKEMREAVVMESALRLRGGTVEAEEVEEEEKGGEEEEEEGRGASLALVAVVKGGRVALPRGGCATLW